MKKLTFFPLLFLVAQIFAQSKANERFVYGFSAGIEMQSLGIETFGKWPDEPTAWSAGANAGVTIGAFARKPLWRWLHFQPELALTFVENKIIFWPDGPRTYRFLDAELPLHLVITDWQKSDALLRGCVIFGGRMGWNFASNPSSFFKLSPERFALDLGLGAEIKIKRWRLQPAFVYSHGMNDQHFLNDAKYDLVLGRMVRDKLALRLLVWKFRK